MRRVDDAVAVDIGVAASDGPLVVPICGAVIASYALPWLAFDGCQSTAREDPRDPSTRKCSQCAPRDPLTSSITDACA